MAKMGLGLPGMPVVFSIATDLRDLDSLTDDDRWHNNEL